MGIRIIYLAKGQTGCMVEADPRGIKKYDIMKNSFQRCKKGLGGFDLGDFDV